MSLYKDTIENEWDQYCEIIKDRKNPFKEIMNNKFKVGDKVRVLEDDLMYSDYKKGQILTIENFSPDGNLYLGEYYLQPDHIELVRDFETGIKNATVKPDVTLISYIALEEISKTLMFGEIKHGRNNYKKGLPYSKFIGSAMRHLGKYNEGIDTDEESGENHIAHCAANLLMLLWTINNKPEMDDRS